MAYPIDSNRSIVKAEEVKVLAQKNLRDAFKNLSFNLFNLFSKEIVICLTDYFTLMNDMKFQLNEEERRVYSDYGFVVSPVHKAFESYLKGFYGFLGLKVSFKPNETVGHYLNIEDSEKEKSLDGFRKRFPFVKEFSRQKWIDAWNALKQEWNDNRNPLSHQAGERIPTLRQAEQVVSSIIRQMDVSSQLFIKEFYLPLAEEVKEDIEEQKKDKRI